MLRKNLTTITTMVLMIAVVAAAVLLCGTNAAYVYITPSKSTVHGEIEQHCR